jgi:hypothetical protein
MKRFLLVILIGLMIGCATTQPQRVVTEDNYVTFEYPEIRLKISDEMTYLAKDHKSASTTRGMSSKYEIWHWKSKSGPRGFFIRINTLTEGGWSWAGSPNIAWKRDIVYYESFPETFERGGKKWYVDVIRWKAYNKVIFGRDVGQRKRLWLVYWEEEGTYENWKDLLKRADKTIEFLP